MDCRSFLETRKSRTGAFSYGLRFLKKEDLPYLYSILTAPEVMWGTLQIPSRQLGPLLTQWQVEVESAFDIVAEILDGPWKGRVIGNCGIRRGVGGARRNHVAGLGMSVDPNFHGEGIGTSLVAKVLEVADKWWRLVRVELDVYTDNQPAIRLYEKCGFEIEGERKDFVIRKGAYVNAFTMSRIRHLPISPGSANSTSAVEGLVIEDLAAKTSSVTDRAGPDDFEIRPPIPEDAERLYAFYCDSEVARNAEYLPWAPPPLTKITSELQSQQQNHVFLCVKDDHVLGRVSLTCHRNRMSRNGDISVLVTQKPIVAGALPRVVASHLIRKIVELSEDWLGVHRLEVQTYPHEDSVISALLDNGFEQEARLRMASLRDGVYEDRLVWARLSGVWQ